MTRSGITAGVVRRWAADGEAGFPAIRAAVGTAPVPAACAAGIMPLIPMASSGIHQPLAAPRHMQRNPTLSSLLLANAAEPRAARSYPNASVGCGAAGVDECPGRSTAHAGRLLSSLDQQRLD